MNGKGEERLGEEEQGMISIGKKTTRDDNDKGEERQGMVMFRKKVTGGR